MPCYRRQAKELVRELKTATTLNTFIRVVLNTVNKLNQRDSLIPRGGKSKTIRTSPESSVTGVSAMLKIKNSAKHITVTSME